MIILHGVPLSVHTRKAVATAILKGLDYRCEPVVPFNPPENWPQLSPTGLIPVMEHDGLVLPDSTAICLYLERIHPAPAVLPSDPKAYARALWFDAYAGGTLFRHVVQPLFFQRVIRPAILHEATDPGAVTAILDGQRPKIFDYLERQASGGYLAGDAFSLGDLAVACNLINYLYLGFSIDAERWPRLLAYAQRVIALPALQRALAAERPFAEQFGLALQI